MDEETDDEMLYRAVKGVTRMLFKTFDPDNDLGFFRK